MSVSQEQRLAVRLGWLRAALLITAAAWGANQFAPLLSAYRSQLGLSTATVTGLFAIYVAGMIPGLLLGGPGADALGRRPVVLGAVGLSLLATVALMGDRTVLLAVGRFASGAAMGAVLAAGTTWVKELSQPPHDPHALPAAGARRASLLLTAGFGVGGFVAAMIGQWGTLVATYVPHLVLSAVVLVLAWRLPETRPERGESGPTGVRDPRFRRLVVPTAVWVFAAPSTGFAVLPGLVEKSLAGYETAFAGLAIAMVLGAGLLIQPVGRRLAERGVLVVALTGLGTVAAGMLVGAMAAWTAQPVLALAADLLLGAGYGLCVTFGLTEIAKIAPPHGLARLASIYWALTYVGFCAPYVFALLSYVATAPVILGGAAGLAVLTALLVLAGHS